MQIGVSSSRRDRTALGTSIALHALVLAGLVAMPRAHPFPADEPDERILLTSIVRVQRAPTPQPHAARHAAAPAAARPRPQAAVTPTPLRVAVATAHAQRALVVAAERRYAPPARRTEARHAAAAQAPLRVGDAPAAHRVAVAPAAATATPSAVPVASVAPAPATPEAASAERELGQGNFGETYPARPMPGMLDTLRARLPHLVARVTVDEHGRATSVVVVAGAADAAARDEITRTLLAATYIPASCNGLNCAQTFDLRT